MAATTGKPLRALINTHCHLDHTSGNVVFDDLPILAHEKTLTAMEQSLGPRSGDRWTFTDFTTKLRMLFAQNIMELVPEGDPAQAWFRQRIGLPDYDTVTILPPTQTSVSVPAEFLEPDTDYKLEVIAQEESGNRTITEEATFTTDD